MRIAKILIVVVLPAASYCHYRVQNVIYMNNTKLTFNGFYLSQHPPTTKILDLLEGLC
jgi:uncharacterized membrane protein YwaF